MGLDAGTDTAAAQAQADACKDSGGAPQWFAMRDLKRANAAEPAWRVLPEKGFEVFTPMKNKIRRRLGQKIVERAPVMPGLLFVHSDKEKLDAIVRRTPTLQYIYLKGRGYRQPAIIRGKDMRRFISAVMSQEPEEYFFPSELKPEMVGKTILIHGGPLDGYKVPLKKVRGSKRKRVIIEIPSLLAAVVELTDFDSIEVMREKSGQ